MTNKDLPAAKGPERPKFTIRSLVSSLACCLVLAATASCGGELAPREDPSAGAIDEGALHAATAATAWQVTGVGVNYRGTGSAGSNVFIGYAGYGYSDAQAQAFVHARDSRTGTRSPNASGMINLAAAFAPPACSSRATAPAARPAARGACTGRSSPHARTAPRAWTRATTPTSPAARCRARTSIKTGRCSTG